MKEVLTLCIAALCSLNATAQNENVSDLREKAQMIPVISYTPTGFFHEVRSSFNFNEAKPCYFIKKDADNSHKLYWYDNPYSDGLPVLQEIKVDLPLSARQSEMLQSRDSVFIFNPLPDSPHLIPLNIAYIGYLDDGHIYYANKDNTYDRLDDFLTHEFGSTSNFRQRYLSTISNSFDTHWSCLYRFADDNEAIGFLKNNYKFMAVTGKDIDDILPRYIELLKSKLTISDSQESRLTDILRKAYDNDGQCISDFLAGRDFDVFRPDFLRSVLSQEEYDLLKNVMDENDAKLSAAYRRLLTYRLNIDENGAYTTDRDRLKIIAGRVYSD